MDGEYRRPLEYTLIELGLRLRWLDTDLLTARDLLVIVEHSPLQSALNRAIRGNAADYQTGEYLLVAVLNTLKGMSWQLGQDRKAPKPELFYAPGMKNPTAATRLGDSMSIEEMDRRLEQYKPR